MTKSESNKHFGLEVRITDVCSKHICGLSGVCLECIPANCTQEYAEFRKHWHLAHSVSVALIWVAIMATQIIKCIFDLLNIGECENTRILNIRAVHYTVRVLFGQMLSCVLCVCFSMRPIWAAIKIRRKLGKLFD